MKCRKCGADLLDTDTFCVKCGHKAGEPMFCLYCGEELRDGERFCHKCGSPVEKTPEDDEIPLSRQRTVDIPFDQIEQAILMEAEQAVVKRPKAERTERRNPEDYNRPGAEETDRRRQSETEDRDLYRRPSVKEPECDEAPDDEKDERYEMQRRPKRGTAAARSRYEEEYDEDDMDEDDDDDSGDSRMKIITVILGIVVVAIALTIGFIFWQRNHPSDGGGPGTGTGQGEQADGEEEDGTSPDTLGRIQILSNVNVRNKPTTEGSEVMMVAKTGETYEYYELVDDAWYHIKLEDGKEGYVSAKYVEDLE